MEWTLDEIISDAEILLNSAEEDYQKKQYLAYLDYLNETNLIINKLRRIDESANKIVHINQVPPGERSSMGIGTQADIAKHREIINTLKKIITRYKENKETLDNSLIKLERILDLIFLKFHQVARQLRKRYNSRPTLDVDDEYDVQDLLHSLLKIYFDDIRPEENTPSYAGSSKRIDFLLKNESIVIEVKKTRKGLDDKKVGEELVIDISTYNSHPDCKSLFCFVYDPEGRIINPIGLEKDLEKLSKKDLNVKVFVYPK